MRKGNFKVIHTEICMYNFISDKTSFSDVECCNKYPIDVCMCTVI